MGDLFRYLANYYCSTMIITACGNINNNLVKLEYTSLRHKTNDMPSYTISADKADEFVKKYNKQSEIMTKTTLAVSLLCGVTGFISSGKKSNFMKKLLKTAIGVSAGFILSALTAYELNNRLMDKYDVKPFNG